MSKLVTLIVFVTIIEILFWSFGLLNEGGSMQLLDKVGIIHLEGIHKGNVLYDIIFALGGITLAGVAIAALRGSVSLDMVLFVTVGVLLVPVFFGVLQDMIIIFGFVSKVNILFALLLFAPLVILFIMSIFEWMQGRP